MTGEVLLDVRNIKKHFGGVQALDDISMQVFKNEILGIIGPNGAGKTTFFNCISGYLQPSSGEVFFMGKSIIKYKPHRINRMGMARTFQNGAIFPRMTVLENIMTGLHGRCNAREQIRRAEYLAEYVGLAERVNEPAMDLPHGLQSRLQIAIGLATNPKLLLLDEPAAGMSPDETRDLMDFIAELPNMGVTVCLIEHNMDVIMNICNRIFVLNLGRKLAEGVPEEIKSNPEVIKAYLGRGYVA